MRTIILFVLLTVVFHINGAAAANTFPAYNLSISFDLEKGLLKGISTIVLKGDSETNVSAGNLQIKSVTFNGLTLYYGTPKGSFKVSGSGTLEIVYEGIFKGVKTEKPESDDSLNVISEKGIILTQGWYPSIGKMSYFNLKAIPPAGFTAVSEADDITVSDSGRGREYSFNFPHPLKEITFTAGRYTEMKDDFHGIGIYGYFFPDDSGLAKNYLEDAAKFLKIYEEHIGQYPYKRFSVIENFFQAGYSRPTITLLGQDVIRRQSPGETSLRRDIIRQWFGNFVYVDYEKGNWSDGLNAYLSGSLTREQNDTGWQHRKNILIECESYLNHENEFPLSDFTKVNLNGPASKAIGHGKGSMVFHMLRNFTGDEIFYRALKDLIQEKKFQTATWNDLKISFEKASGKDLGWFFTQWLTRKDAPSIDIGDLRVSVLNGIPTVTFYIIQKNEPFRFNLPLNIRTDKGDFSKIITIEKEKQTFEIPVIGEPAKIVLDGDYDVLRKLVPEEIPPVLSNLLGDEKRTVVIPEEESELYGTFIDIFKKKGFIPKNERDLKEEDIRKSSLLVPGTGSSILKRLFGRYKESGKGFSLDIRKNPLNTEKVIAVASADSKGEADAAAEKILGYGKYTFLRFESGVIKEKTTGESEKGIDVGLREQVVGIQPKKTIDLKEIINKILDKPVIYLGERHTNYEDHKVELKVIMGLYEKGRKFAIGMEMFQKPFQKPIDDFLSGAIDERQFLKATEYFKRWQFDYNLYREIVEYARAKRIPIVALNQWAEIVQKVSSDGLYALTDLERQQIPEDMDMSDEDYRDRLKEIFENHPRDIKSFDNFYEAQILWDETMAHSVDGFLKKNPDYQIVVMAGAGHIMYGSGIPKRAYRLNGKEYVTVLPSGGTPEEGFSDFILFPEHISPPLTLKLGIMLKETDGRVKVDGIIPGSRVRDSGMKKGDILVALDDWKIENISDVRIFMFDKKPGDTIKMKVLRKRFLSGYEPLELTATL